MKTAIQQLIDVLDINETNFISRIDDQITIAYHNAIKKTVVNFLEKEKDQIIHAHAHHRCVNDKTMECTIKAYENAEQYYNQTYNENQ